MKAITRAEAIEILKKAKTSKEILALAEGLGIRDQLPSGLSYYDLRGFLAKVALKKNSPARHYTEEMEVALDICVRTAKLKGEPPEIQGPIFG